MSKNYTHLSVVQRYQIEALLLIGSTQKSIAENLGVSASTICREIQRNSPKAGVGALTYSGSNAQRRTRLRHRDKPKHHWFNAEMKQSCRNWLKIEKYSPEIMSVEGRKKWTRFVSHETIYKWIWECKKSHRREDSPDKKLYLQLKHNPRRQKRG